MDRRVKERLVGATILGVLIVLLVPEMLSGPKPAAAPAASSSEPVRNVTVDLTTRQSVAPAPTAAQASSAAEPDTAGSATPPPAAPAAAQAAAQAAAHAAAPVADAPAPVESPSSSPISQGGDTAHRGWALQVGSFASRENADKLVHQLKAHGYSAYVISNGSGATIRHKVRVGPVTDRAAAERLLVKLKGQKYSPSIVLPDSRQ
jgi:DedD protein